LSSKTRKLLIHRISNIVYPFAVTKASYHLSGKRQKEESGRYPWSKVGT